jgi:tetratricopeptide (TPR) repeat protein
MRLAVLTFTIAVLAASGAARAGRDTGSDAAGALERGRQQIERGEYDAAVSSLTLAREASPNDAAIYNALADAYAKMGAEPMAVVQLEKSLAVDSTQIDTRLRLAEIHSRNRRWQEAARLYQAVLRRDPQNDTAALLLGHLYSMARQPAAAARALSGYVTRHPGDENVAKQYLDALVASGQDAAAASSAETILQSRPDWPPALLAAARANARLNRPEAAVAQYLKLDASQPLAGSDAFAVGRCYLALQKETEATRWFERALRDSLDPRTDWSEAAAVFMRAKRWPEAASLYERKLAQDSTAVSAWINYGLCKQQSKDYEAARRALGRAVALRPEDVKTQYALATNYVLQDSTRAARRAYQSIPRLAAGHEGDCREELRQSYRWLAVQALVDKDWNAALPNLDAALRFDPQDVELRLYRAQALVAVNRKQEAKQEFETVLHMQPGNKEARKGLTLVAQYN